MITNLLINLPVAISVEDYHEFTLCEELLEKLNSDLVIHEIAFGQRKYWAIIYNEQEYHTREQTLQCLRDAGLNNPEECVACVA